MARSGKRARVQGTARRYSPRLFAVLTHARDHFVDAICNRAKIDLCLVFARKAVTLSSCFFSGRWFGSARRLVDFAARSQHLDRCWTSQDDTRRCLRRVFQEVSAGNVLSVFIVAPFLSQHDSHKFIGMQIIICFTSL